MIKSVKVFPFSFRTMVFFLLQKNQTPGIMLQNGRQVVTIGNSDVLFGGITELRTVEDMGEGGVKKPLKSGDVLYGRPLKGNFLLLKEIFIPLKWQHLLHLEI